MTYQLVPGLAAVEYCMARLGKGIRYVFAGSTDAGYDCSGYVMAGWGAADVTLPHNALAQSQLTARLGPNRQHLEPGDLVFYGRPIGHVAMFIGYALSGDPMVVQATNEQRGIEVISIDEYVPHVLLGRPKYPGWRH